MPPIASFEEARIATGRPQVPSFCELPADLRAYFAAHYKMVVVTEALNQEYRANWRDDWQNKYVPAFYNQGSRSGYAFAATAYHFSVAHGYYPSRLCLASHQLADYVGQQFAEIANDLMRK